VKERLKQTSKGTVERERKRKGKKEAPDVKESFRGLGSFTSLEAAAARRPWSVSALDQGSGIRIRSSLVTCHWSPVTKLSQ
jgi:hypothetical protein